MTVRRKFAAYCRKKFFDYCRETSAHGLSHINETRALPVKVIWSTVFLACLCMSVAGLVDTAVKYAARPMAIDQKIMPNTTIRFPRIDICTRKRFDGTKVKALNLSLELIQTIDAAYMSGEDDRLLERVGDKPHLEKQLKDLIALHKYKDFGELLVQLVPDCWDVFEKSFAGDSHGWRTCETLPMEHLLWPDGSCFSVEGVQSRADTTGLLLWLKFPMPEEKYVHADNVDPYGGYTVDSLDTRLIPGALSQIFFKLRTIKTVSRPPNQLCVEDEDYNIVKCRLECSSLVKASYCGCQPAREAIRKLTNDSGSLSLPDDSVPICDPWELIQCFQRRRFWDPNRLDEIAYEKCKSKCGYPCTTNIYDFRVVQSKMDPDKMPYQYSGGNLTRYRMSRGLVDVRVEFVHDHYILVRQYETMKMGSVFSHFGGQLGLFLGCSILTIIHTILFCGQALIELIASPFRRRSKATRPEEYTESWVSRPDPSGYTGPVDGGAYQRRGSRSSQVTRPPNATNRWGSGKLYKAPPSYPAHPLRRPSLPQQYFVFPDLSSDEV